MIKFATAFLSLAISASSWAGFIHPHRWSCELLLSDVALNSRISRYNEALHPRVMSKLLNLRDLLRRGWLDRGVPRHLAEDVFIHTIKVTRAAEIISLRRPDLNANLLIPMILVHDIGELGKIGDVTPFDGTSKADKAKGELETLMEFYRDDPEAFAEVIELWTKFELQQSPEAILAFQLDKIDAAIQAIRYEKMGYPPTDMYIYARERISDPFLAKVYELTMSTRFTDKDPYKVYFKFLETLPHD